MRLQTAYGQAVSLEDNGTTADGRMSGATTDAHLDAGVEQLLSCSSVAAAAPGGDKKNATCIPVLSYTHSTISRKHFLCKKRSPQSE